MEDLPQEGTFLGKSNRQKSDTMVWKMRDVKGGAALQTSQSWIYKFLKFEFINSTKTNDVIRTQLKTKQSVAQQQLFLKALFV